MSSHKITNKHLELIADKTIKAVFSIFGMLNMHIDGKITGRLRNRFRTFVFTPTFPTFCFTFTANDVQSIETSASGIAIYLNQCIKTKKRRKKKLATPVVAIEPEKPSDLNKPSNQSNGSYTATDPVLQPSTVQTA